MRSGWRTCVAILLLGAGLIGPCQRADADFDPKTLLAGQYVANALITLASPDLSLDGLEAATLMLEEAARLTPEDPSIWRHLLNLGELAEDEELQSRCVERLGELAPDDEVIQWRRLTIALSDYQTIGERIDAYTEFLGDPERIGSAVASRLAFDLGLLHQRRGDEMAFADWLGTAIELDPGNRAAAALAAGFFRTRTDGPVEEAELLLNLLLADPVDLGTHVELARVLLDSGAYAGAARMLATVAAPREAAAQMGAAELFGDLALAQWGAGDPEAALATLLRFERDANTVFRNQLALNQPELTPLEIARRKAPTDPTLATLRLAITSKRSPDERTRAWNQAEAAFTESRATFSEDEPQRLAELLLQQALVTIYFGPDIDNVQALIDEAGALVPLTEDARNRFAGWLALRGGDPEAALATLTPLAESDELAKLGAALARLQLGDHRPGATALLEVARGRPGAIVGVAAATELFELLGRRAPLSAEASRLDALIEDIPTIFDRYVSDPTLCQSLRVRPTKTSFAAYEPILIELDLINTSPHPLAINRNGPIRPQVILEATAQVPSTGDEGGLLNLPPLIVDIDRALTLAPRQRLIVPINLRRTSIAQLFEIYALRGLTLNVKATTNFRAVPNPYTNGVSYFPGPLGVSSSTGPIRVEGVRPDGEWIGAALAVAADEGKPRDIVQVALLGQIASSGLGAEALTEDLRRLLRSSVTAVVEAYDRVEPAGQAWLIAALPRGDTTEPIFAKARSSDDRSVKISYINHCVQSVDDPMLDAALRDEDPIVRRTAELFLKIVSDRQE